MTEKNSSLLKLINASGFLFQLSVENKIKESCSSNRNSWRVQSREHRWIDPVSGKEFFIDLILQDHSETQRLVIECKRVRDGTWVFLSNRKSIDRNQAKILWTYKKSGSKDQSGWYDFSLSTLSPESSMCIVRGQGEKDQPMLERLSGFVLRSTEVLANNELEISSSRESRRLHFYIPIIITNANIQICYLNVDEIDIGTGKIDDAEFESVPFVRFRKSLSSTIKPQKPIRNLNEASYHQERSIFVVNSNEMQKFFNEFDFTLGMDTPWPK